MPAVAQHGQLHPPGTAVVEQRLDAGPDGAPREEDVVDQHDRVVPDREVDVRGVDDGLPRRRAQVKVVAVEGDVDVPERDRLLDEPAQKLVDASRKDGPAAMDADDRHALAGVLLDDLVGDAHQRAPDVLAVEDGLLVLHVDPSWPRWTGLKG